MRSKNSRSLLNSSTTPHGRLSFSFLLLAFVLTSAVNRYNDDEYEYRHVQLPKNMLKAIPKDYFDGSRGTLKLLWEDEWRGLGITQVSARAFN